MENSKIKFFILLFTFFFYIREEKIFKIIKHNIYLNNKLDLSINDYKEFFFGKK